MVTIILENKKYQLEVQKGIQHLVKYHMENPDLGEPMDYLKDDKRLEYYSKQFKELSVDDVVEQLTMLVDEDQICLDLLLNNKVIFEVQ